MNAPPLRWPPLQTPPEPLAPEAGEVLLVCAPLDLPEGLIARLRETLDPIERARADRFVTAQLRSRFVAGRGLLRWLLGWATGAAPAALRFRYGEHGKPALEPQAGTGGLGFNVSHSQGLALYALSRGVVLGVDLEAVQGRQSDGVADRFFHPDESAWLRKLPDGPRTEAFYAIWCAKEAFIKATGLGLSQGLDSFSFACGPEGPVRLGWLRGDPRGPERFELHRLDPAAGFRAALITEGRGLRTRCFSWAPGVATAAAD